MQSYGSTSSGGPLSQTGVPVPTKPVISGRDAWSDQERAARRRQSPLRPLKPMSMAAERRLLEQLDRPKARPKPKVRRKPGPAPAATYDPQQIVALCKQGLPASQIAEEAGCSTTTVHRVLNKAGLVERRKLLPKGEAIRLYQEGYTVPAISQRLGFNTRTIYKALGVAGVERRDDRVRNGGAH